MDYLISVDPDNYEIADGFVCPSLLRGNWTVLFKKILPENVNYISDRNNAIINLSYRMQFLEYLHGIIAYHYKCKDEGKNSTLHESVLRMSIQTYCVYGYSIFEGIGTYIRRIETNANGEASYIQWRKYLTEYFSKNDFSNDDDKSIRLKRKRKTRYIAFLDKLRDLRNRVHLDELLNMTDYHSFDRKAFNLSSFMLKVFLEKHFADGSSPNFSTMNMAPNIVKL